MDGKCAQLAALLPSAQEGALITSEHNRRYLTGFRSSAGAVLVTQAEAYFLTDFRYIEAAGQRVRGAQCLCYRRLTDTLAELLARHGLQCLHIEGEAVTLAEEAGLREALPSLSLAGNRLDGWLKELRLVKTAEELACIRQAQKLTDDAFTHILSFIRPGRTEREIALELEFHIRSHGAEGASFDFIAVSGPNSSLPHGEPGDRKGESGDFVTMDFGAVVDGWHSDMTRTVAVGAPNEEQRRVYDTVLQAHRACLAVLREGLSCREGDAAARRIIEEAGYGDCFGHATGHGVGVQIHEEPRLSPSAREETLRAGTVVTVEPGIYLPGRFGVRIEDMAYITPGGCEDLTASLKELIVL